jgi:hypothetical protein
VVVAANVSPLVPAIVSIQQGTPIGSPAATAMVADPVTVTAGAPAVARIADPGVSLSLAANKASPIMSMGPASGKNSTNMLDEVYRQLGAVVGVSQSGWNVGISGEDTTEDWWYLESALIDLEVGKKSDE